MTTYREPANTVGEGDAPIIPTTRYVVVIVGKGREQRYVKNGYTYTDNPFDATLHVSEERAVLAALTMDGPVYVSKIQFTETPLTHHEHQEAALRLAKRRWP